MNSVTFAFHVETSTGEIVWRITADITHEGSGYHADLTSAHPSGDDGDYDVSDLESSLADEDNGRSLADVRQAAIDEFCDRDESGPEWDGAGRDGECVS